MTSTVTRRLGRLQAMAWGVAAWPQLLTTGSRLPRPSTVMGAATLPVRKMCSRTVSAR